MNDDGDGDEQAGRVFRQVGAKGPSKAADDMRKKGLFHFDRFLVEKRMPCFAELTAESITIELFQEFGGYLCFDAEKKDGELFAWESISKFISGVKRACMEDSRLSRLRMWSEDNAQWYCIIYCF